MIINRKRRHPGNLITIRTKYNNYILRLPYYTENYARISSLRAFLKWELQNEKY
jgi:hypothetical protein